MLKIENKNGLEMRDYLEPAIWDLLKRYNEDYYVPTGIDYDQEVTRFMEEFVTKVDSSDPLAPPVSFVSLCIQENTEWIALSAAKVVFGRLFSSIDIMRYDYDYGMVILEAAVIQTEMEKKGWWTQLAMFTESLGVNELKGLDHEKEYLANSAAYYRKAGQDTDAGRMYDLVGDLLYTREDWYEAARYYVSAATRWDTAAEPKLRNRSASRAIKAANEDGDHHKLSQIFYQAKQLLYKDTMSGSVKILNWMTGYYEKPIRIANLGAVIVLLYGILYAVAASPFGLTKIDNAHTVFDRVVIAIYYSVVTFTTLGYGDIAPNDSVTGMIFAMTEVVVGLLLFGLFLFTLGKKTSPR